MTGGCVCMYIYLKKKHENVLFQSHNKFLLFRYYLKTLSKMGLFNYFKNKFLSES